MLKKKEKHAFCTLNNVKCHNLQNSWNADLTPFKYVKSGLSNMLFPSDSVSEGRNE